MKKKTYSIPQITVHGNVEVLTQKTRTGSSLDGDYPRGTSLTDPILS
jgi:hypothetical protein